MIHDSKHSEDKTMPTKKPTWPWFVLLGSQCLLLASRLTKADGGSWTQVKDTLLSALTLFALLIVTIRMAQDRVLPDGSEAKPDEAAK